MKVRFVLPLILAACGDGDASGRVVRESRDAFGLLTCSEATETRTCVTHRATAGLSMGAGVAAQLAFGRPELFDATSLLGAPAVELGFLLRTMRRAYLGGFCDRDTLLANVDRLDDPDGPAFCGPVEGIERFEPSGRALEPAQDFNHWWTGPNGGRGGEFGRNKFRDAFHDLVLAYGNPTLYNPVSPFLPPGVPAADLMLSDADRCAAPRTLRGVYDARYNPDGRLPVIVPCDTSTATEGDFDPARPADLPVDFGLAVDVNQNGRRDYAEPVIVQMSEPFEDVGLSSDDRYDWSSAPAGRGGNGDHDEGEPYEDLGLDGVAGTADFGEGNGRFDLNPNTANWLAHGPRALLAAAPDAQLQRMHFYADAGIRDFLLSAGATNWLWASLKARLGPGLVKDYTQQESLPGVMDGDFDFLAVDYRPEGIGRHAYVRYGDPGASAEEIAQGDGNHVGQVDQLLARVLTGFAFLDARFIELDRKVIQSEDDMLLFEDHFYSRALDEDRLFGVALPPGYRDPQNAEVRYPVVYLFHGLGVTHGALLLLSQLFVNYMTESDRDDRSARGLADFGKFIIIVPDLRCHRGECKLASFGANQRGLDGAGARFQDAIFELMADVESRYRVRAPIELDADDPALAR